MFIHSFIKILVDHAISQTRPYFFLTVRPFPSLLPHFVYSFLPSIDIDEQWQQQEKVRPGNEATFIHAFIALILCNCLHLLNLLLYWLLCVVGLRNSVHSGGGSSVHYKIIYVQHALLLRIGQYTRLYTRSAACMHNMFGASVCKLCVWVIMS